MKSRTKFVAVLVLVALPGLPAKAGSAPPAKAGSKTASSETAGDARGACRLITPAEVETIQGEAPITVESRERSADGLLVLQCVYTLKTYSKSVVLEVTRTDPARRVPPRPEPHASAVDPDGASKTGPARLGPKERWNRLFHGGRQTGREREHEGEEEDERAREAGTDRKGDREEEESFIQPKPVDGIGREAFWVGNAVMGGLYVLKGDSYFRISIGGAETEAARLAKTKALAGSALTRLGKLR